MSIGVAVPGPRGFLLLSQVYHRQVVQPESQSGYEKFRITSRTWSVYLMDMFWVPTHRQYVRVAASSADRLSRIRRVACEVRDLGLVSLRERCC